MEKSEIKIKFREATPERRPNPSSATKYQDHRAELESDFRSYCGYCHSHDMFKHTFYEIDHFIPLDFLKTIGSKIEPTDYNNLVYACRYCNNAKRKKWPSQSEQESFKGNEGFIDPCKTTYSEQFYRCKRGRIYGETDLGKWMTRTFKFQIRERQIELVWQLRQLDVIMQELLKEQARYKINSETWNLIENSLNRSARLFYTYDRELRNYK